MSKYMDNKMDNLEEVDKFLDKYNLPTWSQEEIENVNRPITSNEIESVIKQNKTKKTFKQTKVQDQRASQVNSTKHLEKS